MPKRGELVRGLMIIDMHPPNRAFASVRWMALRRRLADELFYLRPQLSPRLSRLTYMSRNG